MHVEQQNSGNAALQLGSVAPGASVTHKVFTLFNLTCTVNIRPRRAACEANSESDRQHAFCQRTGIECGPQAREWLEHLMAVRQFTLAALRNAWHHKTIGWNTETQSPWVMTHRLEAVFAWTVLALMSAWMLSFVTVLALSEPAAGELWLLLVKALGALGIYLFYFWLLDWCLLRPRSTALKLEKVLKQKQKQPKGEHP